MDAADKEVLRHAVLEMLVAREGTAHSVPAIRRRVLTMIDFAASEADIEVCLDFHIQAGRVKFDYDPNGASRYWQATPAGVLAVERC